MKEVEIKLVKSPIGTPAKHKKTVIALGLGKMNSTVIKELSPQVAGMIKKVEYLLQVTER